MKIRVYEIADGLYGLPQDMLIPQVRQQLSYPLTIFVDNYGGSGVNPLAFNER